MTSGVIILLNFERKETAIKVEKVLQTGKTLHLP